MESRSSPAPRVSAALDAWLDDDAWAAARKRAAAALGVLYDVLPLIALGIFVAIFATVLIRVCQRARMPEYRRMASLPLDDDTQTGGKQ